MTQQTEMQRRFENVLVAEARVHARLTVLMMGVAGGYPDLDGNEPATVARLEEAAEDVIEAAGELKRVVASGGDWRPPGVDV